MVFFHSNYGSYEVEGWDLIGEVEEGGFYYSTIRTKVLTSDDITTGHVTYSAVNGSPAT